MPLSPLTSPMPKYEFRPEDIEWWSLTPAQRLSESQKLWATYLALGGSLDPEPDTQSPFHFEKLWERREVVSSRELGHVNVLSLSDLVTAKKTQRDKDWPMSRRLVEVDYFRNRNGPPLGQVDFWLCEVRTPELLVELVGRRPARARRLEAIRPLLRIAATGDVERLGKALRREQEVERAADRKHWLPLRRELEVLRRTYGSRAARRRRRPTRNRLT